MRNVARLLGTFVATVVIGGIAVGVCLAALVPGTVEIATAHRYTVKQVKELSGLAETTAVYWADGTKMGTLGLLDREIVPLTEVPERIQNAVIATEDRTFWTNDGIDLGAVFRAFLTNVVSGEINQGGSTITQQLVKNRIVGAKRDVNRKVRELEDALRLNEKFSKQKILEEYLNTVYFGQGSYGIKAAARRFYLTIDPLFGVVRGKQMSELTIGEAALLAGVISSPEGNNPFTYPDRAKRRRADVLRAEVEQGYVTQAESDAANLEPLPTAKPPAEQRPTNYLVAEVQDRLLNDPRYADALGHTLAERKDKILKGGLQIFTTFDRRLQAIAEDATANATAVLNHGPGWESSLVSIDPSTGMVRAMVGGPDFGVDQYNIATHPPGRQPGSTWKIITLAAALANGYSPNDLVDGTEPCAVPSQFPLVPPDQLPNNSADGAENGYHTIEHSTAASINCAFVRLSTSVGLDRVIDMAKGLGLTQDTLRRILNLSIGTIEATPLEMATVMATIANMGVKQTPIFVSKIVNRDGITIVDDTVRTDGVEVLAPDVAACTQNVLRGVITGGTGTAAAVAGHLAYGKTGTTDLTTDAWFVGGTPPGVPLQLATAVWFGYRQVAIPGAGFGGASSAPIFSEFMSGALEGVPDVGLPGRGPVCARAGAAGEPGRRAHRRATTADRGAGGGAAADRDPAAPDARRHRAAGGHRADAGRHEAGRDVTDPLEALLVVQEHDLALDRLRHRRETLPERAALAAASARAAEVAARTQVVSGERDTLAREETRLDDEARTLEARAKEVEAKMYSGEVTSPRELQAMQADVEQLQRHRRDVENRELEIMEQREPFDAELASLAERGAALAAESATLAATLAEGEQVIDAEMRVEHDARDALTGDLDTTLLAAYEQRRGRAQGVGIARLVGNTCQGCHLTIPSTEAERIKRAPAGSLASCDNCGCMLVPASPTSPA